MSRLWKELKVNFMYWRFRHVTRNRLRLQSWTRQHRPSVRGASPLRPRGSAAFVYRRSGRRSWIAFLGVVVALTALAPLGSRLGATLVWILSLVVIVGGLYWAMRAP